MKGQGMMKFRLMAALATTVGCVGCASVIPVVDLQGDVGAASSFVTVADGRLDKELLYQVLGVGTHAVALSPAIEVVLAAKLASESGARMPLRRISVKIERLELRNRAGPFFNSQLTCRMDSVVTFEVKEGVRRQSVETLVSDVLSRSVGLVGPVKDGLTACVKQHAKDVVESVLLTPPA